MAKEKVSEENLEKEIEVVIPPGPIWSYWKLNIKLRTPMLGTCTEASIWDEHVLQKAKKEIKRVNSILKKVAKSAQKYVGSEITEHKEIEELKGILRTFQELSGDKEELPNNIEELLETAKSIEERWNEIIAEGENVKTTIFMRNENGQPMISSHMILGNIKENIKVAVNNGDTIMKSKKSVSETLAVDIKPIEHFLVASEDIKRAVINSDGSKSLSPNCTPERDLIKPDGRIICERPIRFERMGKDTTAIALSEQLPAGTEFETILRIRSKSPYNNEKILHRIFSFGINNGLGAWRGSGNYGSYNFKIAHLPDFTETFDGWN